MTRLLQDIVFQHKTDATALVHGVTRLSYSQFANIITDAAKGLLALSLGRGERVAIYLEKRVETVAAIFAAAAAGGVFVPVNPLLKGPQVAHIARDCDVRVLVTSSARLATIGAALAQCPSVRHVVLVDDPMPTFDAPACLSWNDLLALGRDSDAHPHRVIDADMAAILYTSGSTGKPKGVVLSHRNVVAGAECVSKYLSNTADDRILALLPLSFDAGLNQVTCGLLVGATVVLADYLVPRDVVELVAAEGITGLAGVPPLWIQLARVDWPERAANGLRYITNTGGRMPRATLDRLRSLFPRSDVFLMYGLTEAFRSTYLPPAELDRRPDSIGKAIPGAEILVVREDGTLCGPNEPGELVHRGCLVSQGYWNDPARTAERFRPAPGQPAGIPITEMAVWSGDTVRMDEEGFLYFIGRRDEMIKTSGYRVSPTEVEEIVYSTGLVGEAAAFGVEHPDLGQAIVVAAMPPPGCTELAVDAIVEACRRDLPAFAIPRLIVSEPEGLPRNPNGKIDRRLLAERHAGLFGSTRQ